MQISSSPTCTLGPNEAKYWYSEKSKDQNIGDAPLSPIWGCLENSIEGPQGGHRRLPTLARPLGLYMHQLYAQMDALTGGDQGWDN